MFTYLRNLLKYEPAVVAWALNGGIAMLTAYVLHFTKTEEAAVATIVSALATIYTALKARPAVVPTAIGALATILTAAGAFGFHPSAQTVGFITSVASVALALLFRANVTPVASLNPPMPPPASR